MLEQIKSKKFHYRMGVLCGTMLYYTRKYDDFEEMMQYCESVDGKHDWDMSLCRFCFQTFKDDTYDFAKSCFSQIEMPVNGISNNKEKLAMVILKNYEQKYGEEGEL